MNMQTTEATLIHCHIFTCQFFSTADTHHMFSLHITYLACFVCSDYTKLFFVIVFLFIRDDAAYTTCFAYFKSLIVFDKLLVFFLISLIFLSKSLGHAATP